MKYSLTCALLAEIILAFDLIEEVKSTTVLCLFKLSSVYCMTSLVLEVLLHCHEYFVFVSYIQCEVRGTSMDQVRGSLQLL